MRRRSTSPLPLLAVRLPGIIAMLLLVASPAAAHSLKANSSSSGDASSYAWGLNGATADYAEFEDDVDEATDESVDESLDENDDSQDEDVDESQDEDTTDSSSHDTQVKDHHADQSDEDDGDDEGDDDGDDFGDDEGDD